MQLKKGTIIQTIITDLNISGRGIGEVMIDTKQYFVAVEGAVPQDLVEVKIIKIKKNYLECELIRIVTKSPLRQKAKSDHAEVCGSSPFEILPYSYQLEIKEKEVKRILDNIKHLINYPLVNQIVPSQQIWHYRNKMQYSFGYDEKMQPSLGLHIKKRKYDIFDVKKCYLAEEWINSLLDLLRNEAIKLKLNHQTDLILATVKISKTQPQAILILQISPSTDQNKIQELINTISDNFSQITSIYTETVYREKSKPTKIKLRHQAQQKHIEELITVHQKKFIFQIYPNTFFQPNTKTAEKIYETIHSFIQPTNNDTIIDLFCGTGTIGLTLAPFVKKVIGLEIVKESIKTAKINAKNNKIKNIKFHEADLNKPTTDFQTLFKLPTQIETIIIDPPRAGLTNKLIDAIIALNPKNIIYVSCNLKTFCQNIQTFHSKNYKLQEITPIDQFPHTKHLEIVGKLQRY